ncbi:MAG: hypothetical protein OXG46_02095, partial [Chloroflexi bacterium]|nr:hypothetical protein [Chloroflexota bacterium]
GTLILFYVALASRQMLGISDPLIHIGLAASIRAGLFPPEIPWNPGMPAPYHYGPYLLSGMLAPPSGPDLAFVEELLGTYVWISLFLVVATALLRRTSRFAVLMMIPLLLTPGGLTFVSGEPFSIVQIPVPTGVPSAGLRVSLMDTYWPSVELWRSWYPEMPNITKHAFTLSYALAFVVFAHASRAKRRSWFSILTLAVLIGFLGLSSSTLAPIALFLWAGLEGVWLIQSRQAGALQRSDVIRSASGLALAAMLLLAGGLSSLILGSSVTSGLSFGTSDQFGGWRLLGALDRLPGGVGVLGLGPVAVCFAAILLAWRDRLVQVLAAGAGMLLLVTLLLTYDHGPPDLIRLEGHARNFALFALVLALGVRFAALRSSHWRYAAAAAFIALVAWPTIVLPARNLGLSIRSGVDIANAQSTQRPPGRRNRMLEHLPADRIASYIRDNTPVDARVFSPTPYHMTFATGRSNASGAHGIVHYTEFSGPAYRDVREYLEPAAVRRLGFGYVHAPDSWVAGLPDEAVSRLNDPDLFELLVRDESESLYRVLPAFVTLEAPPPPGSYEALRQAVPATATVYLFQPAGFDTRPFMRTAWALSHARGLGVLDHTGIHLRSNRQAEPLGNRVPDLVIVPTLLAPWMFPAASRQPIWWSDNTAVYALDGAVDPIMSPPPDEPFPFSVQVLDVREANGRITFTATFDDRAPDQWTGQDWVLIATQAPPWHIPTQLLPDGAPQIAMWFDSFLNPGRGTSSLAYEFDLRAPSLAVQREHGEFRRLERSEGDLDSGSYVLAVRLRHEYKPEHWRDAAVIPVLRITVSDAGDISYRVHEDVRG